MLCCVEEMRKTKKSSEVQYLIKWLVTHSSWCFCLLIDWWLIGVGTCTTLLINPPFLYVSFISFLLLNFSLKSPTSAAAAHPTPPSPKFTTTHSSPKSTNTKPPPTNTHSCSIQCEFPSPQRNQLQKIRFR